MSQIDWEKSFFLTPEQVATLGLEGVSVHEARGESLAMTENDGE